MKKFFYSFLFFLVMHPCIYGQTNNIDSLQQLLQTEKTDTGRVTLLNNLSYIYLRFKPDTALLLAQQALSLANEKDFIKGQIRSLFIIGVAFQYTGNYPKALMYFFESLHKAESINDQTATVSALRGIYVNYSERGDERQAVNYALQTVEINKRIHDNKALAKDLLNLSDGYRILNKIDSAKWYNTQGYNFALQQKDTFSIGYALDNFGNIYFKTKEYTKALAYYRLSLPYLKQAKDVEDLCDSYLGMAKTFKETSRFDSCLYYAKLSLSVAQDGGFTRSVMEACNFLTDYYTSVHNIDSAFVYQSAGIVAKDSLFSEAKTNQVQALSLDEVMRKQQTEEAKTHFQNQVRFDALLGGIICLLIAAFFLYRNNKHKQKANALLQQQKEKVESTLSELKSTQKQLIQSEKMASLGELTAGIAHEIQNPLNFVNNFSEVNKELIEELRIKNEELKIDDEEVKELLNDISQNLEKINHHGKRADAIVKGMLQHSRKSEGKKEPTDINALCDEYLRLSYHGLRAKDKSFNAEMKTDFDQSIGKINIVAQDIGRVILNLINNAFYAVNEKKKTAGENYEPTVMVTTERFPLSFGEGRGEVVIKVKDNGPGIPQNIVDKIFQPFFTTKPTGEGTGLGLSLAYDIIKAHGGELKVNTKEKEGSEFIIKLPIN